jgi:A/G-specific adenine glycosylase
VLIAEKLLQQTTYGHVLRVYESFIRRFPDVDTLANADVSEIEGTIRRLGFQRQRARQFKEIASTLVNRYGGKVPATKEELLKLSGIGDYVTNAVLCFAFNKDVPIVDINVRRVVERYFDWGEYSNREIAKRLEGIIPKGKAKQLNWAIIDFSALICSRKPKHGICFLTDVCSHFQRLPLKA